MRPVDLQTMYTQMANVAKQVSGAEQVAQQQQVLQQRDSAVMNEQRNTRVQQTEEGAQSQNVNQNGSNAQDASGQKKRKNNANQEEESPTPRLKESYLGNHIDITR